MKKPATASAVTGLVVGGSVADAVKFDDQIVGAHEVILTGVLVVHDGATIVHGVRAHRTDDLDVECRVVSGQEVEGGLHGGDGLGGLGGGLCAHTNDFNLSDVDMSTLVWKEI